MIRMLFLFLGLIFATLSLQADDPAPVTINVFAAVSLTQALNEIGVKYTAEKKVALKFNFGSSGLLARQIGESAHCDVFISADEKQMDTLQKKGAIVQETRANLLSNALVVIGALTDKPQTSPDFLGSLPAGEKLAIGQPEIVPAGTYAKEYLTKKALWDKAQGHVVPCENVRAVLAAVESDNAAYGIVYKTDALISKKVQVLYEVPESDGPKIVYPVAATPISFMSGDSPANTHSSTDFIAYLYTPAPQDIFRKYGFIPLPAKTSATPAKP